MPLTELILVVSGFAACAVGLAVWLGLGLDRAIKAAGETGAPRWLKVARHPATALGTAIPVLLALGLLAARAALLQAG